MTSGSLRSLKFLILDKNTIGDEGITAFSIAIGSGAARASPTA